MSDQTPTTTPPTSSPAPAAAPTQHTHTREIIREQAPPSRDPDIARKDDLAALRAELEAERRRNLALSERMDLIDAGLTDIEAHDVARALHSRLPAGDDRPSLVEWVRSQVAEPDKASRGLRAYLPQPAAPSTPAAPTAAPTSHPATPDGGSAPPTTPATAPTGLTSQPPAGRTDPSTRLRDATAQLREARMLGDQTAISNARSTVAEAMAAIRAQASRLG